MKKLFSASITMALIASSAQAYDNITAQEAYDMLASGEAIMLDVRTPEEWAWVGHPGKNKLGYGSEIEKYVINIAWEIEKPGHGYEPKFAGCGHILVQYRKFYRAISCS